MPRGISCASTGLRVRWAEVDMQKIVFNGHYLTYIDTAIAEYWREIGLPYPAGYVERYGNDSICARRRSSTSVPRATTSCSRSAAGWRSSGARA